MQLAQRPKSEDKFCSVELAGMRANVKHQLGFDTSAGGAAGAAADAGGLGLSKRESSRGIFTSIFSATIFWDWSVPGASASTRKGYFRPFTSRKSRKKDSQGTSLPSTFRVPSHLRSRAVEVSK